MPSLRDAMAGSLLGIWDIGILTPRRKSVAGFAAGAGDVVGHVNTLHRRPLVQVAGDRLQVFSAEEAGADLHGHRAQHERDRLPSMAAEDPLEARAEALGGNCERLPLWR